MDTEEIQIKLGLKADQLNQELRNVQNEMGKTGEHAKHSFIHAESQGRAFHKVLHEISATSPLMGIALRAALDPMVAVMFSVIKAFKDYEEEQEKAVKASEARARKETEGYMKTFEASAKAREEVRKGREEQEAFEKNIGREKPAEVEKERHGEEIEKARRESSTDSEFLVKKKALDLNEEFIDARKEEIALGEEQRASAKVNDEERIRSIEDLKNKVNALKELQKEGATAGFGGGKEKNELFGLISKEEHNALTQAIGADRANLYGQMREQAEAELRDKETAMGKDKEALAEAKGNVTDFHKAKKDMQKSEKDDDAKLFDAQRKEKAESVKQEIEESKAAHEHNQVAFLTEKIAIEQIAKAEAEAANDKKSALQFENNLRRDNLALASAQKDQAMAQAKLDREISDSRRHRQEAVTKEFMPTLDELAKSMPWQRDTMFDSQRRQDAITMRMGMAFGQQHAGEAQDEMRLKDEMKRALFIEGPESTRFKEDAKKLESLKRGLAAAGLQTSDDRLESIDKHMAALIDMASKEGLVVQPVNGP